MSDWRAYDTVAAGYQRVASPRFETIARRLIAVARPAEGARVLDLGTGTGAVAVALAEALESRGPVVGCDLSLPMLILAQRRFAGLRLVLGNAVRLPFREGSFDLVTANCVLSHLQDYRRALQEILRVLAKPATFTASCWGPVSHPYEELWRELLESTLGEGAVQRVTEAVVPWEGHFSSPHNVRTALLESGFSGAHVEVFVLALDQAVEEYIAERALGAAGRFARQALGESGWREFLQRATTEFARRFDARIRCERMVVLGVGTVA